MKKARAFIMLLSVCFCFTLQAHSPQATWNYNGGSGPQIVVTFDGSQLHIGQNSYNQPLRVDWFTSNGTYSELVYGSTFYPYSHYNFRISGSTSSPVPTSSDSYYNYY